ncbi:MAG: hypothetical protein EOP88_14300 [Verrucomicrobiaceae bacterium]|nr:MAG: hypothetical protein EOP88_14300 [Verrucomicrobiaceae bacterium]
MDTLDHSLREFIPVNGAWLPLETLLEQAFSDPDPKRYYHAIFNLFERFPEEDGPVFWSALHGMEHFGDYEDLLVQYFRRWPTVMTRIMIRRIWNTGQTHIDGIEISKLIPDDAVS